MTDFAIDPPIRILGRQGIFVRSTEQAVGFMRDHMLQHMDAHAAEVLGRLEDVRSAEEAQEAAQAFGPGLRVGCSHATTKRPSGRMSSNALEADAETRVDDGSAAETWR